MATFDYKLEAYIGRRPIHPTEIIVEWDETTPTITYWNEASLGKAKPTDEQLNALESQATTLENNNQVINTRINLYGTTAEQLEYIVENGVDSFVAKQNQIKTENPKS
mgnify:CR=1 FL=1